MAGAAAAVRGPVVPGRRRVGKTGTLRSTVITWLVSRTVCPVCVAHDGDGPSIIDRPVAMLGRGEWREDRGEQSECLYRNRPLCANMDNFNLSRSRI